MDHVAELHPFPFSVEIARIRHKGGTSLENGREMWEKLVCPADIKCGKTTILDLAMIGNFYTMAV